MSAYPISAAVDNDGNATLLWSKQVDWVIGNIARSVLVVSRNTPGVGWSQPIELDNEPAIQIDREIVADAPTGWVVATWSSSQPGDSSSPKGRLARFDPKANAWSSLPEPDFKALPQPVTPLRSVIGPNGQVSTVWVENSSERVGRIYVTDYRDGDGFGPFVGLGAISQPDRRDKIRFERLNDNRLLLVWVSEEPHVNSVAVSRTLMSADRPSDESTWISRPLEQRTDESLQLSPYLSSFEFNGVGQGILLYAMPEAVGQLFRPVYRLRRFTGKWEDPEILQLDAPGTVASNDSETAVPSAAINSSGTISIAWSTPNDNGQTYRLESLRSTGLSGISDGTNSQVETVAELNPRPISPQVSIDDWGRTVISFTQGSSPGDRSWVGSEFLAWEQQLDPRSTSIAPPRRLNLGGEFFTGPAVSAGNRFGDRIMAWPSASQSENHDLKAVIVRTVR